jgi:hypothetical protein
LDTDTASPAITPSEISFVSFHQPNNLAPHQFEEKKQNLQKNKLYYSKSFERRRA